MCILLGYGTETKGYWLYDPQLTVFHSQDVLFKELSYWVEKEPDEQEEKQYIMIHSSSDKEPVADDVHWKLQYDNQKGKEDNPVIMENGLPLQVISWTSQQLWQKWFNTN